MARKKTAPPHIVTAYALAVLDGYYVTGHLVKLACQRHLDDLKNGHKRGLYFDERAADRAIKSFTWLRHTKGPKAGQPFYLEPWQKFCIGSVYGWKKKDGTRRFETVYEEIGRGNGKSTKGAGIGIYGLAWDGENAAEVYSAATKRDQAKIIFKEALRMVRRSPKVRAVCRPFNNKIEGPQEGEFTALSSDASTQDGLNPSTTLLDELHAHKTRAMYDVLQSAEGKRAVSLLWAFTTAGDGSAEHTVCREQRDLAEKILTGVVKDDSYFAYIATIDEGDDWRDENCWIKANPNLGVSISIEKLRTQCERAKVSPAQESEFRRKRCNQWVNISKRWITPEVWAKGAKPAFDLAELEGRECFGAIDLSTKTDLTAFTLVWPPVNRDDPKEPWYTWAWYFIPEEHLARRVKQDQVPYDKWRDQGFLKATSGARIDYAEVRKCINEQCTRFRPTSIAIDPWNAAGMETDLTKDGFEIIEFRQGLRSYSNASKEFEALFMAGLMRHGGHPVTAWMASNVTLKIDDNENYMPKKAGKKLRVDGIMTITMAVGLAFAVDEEDDGVDLSSSYFQ